MRPFTLLSGLTKSSNDALSNMVICENKREARIVKAKGLPYIIWQGTDEDLAKHLFYRVLKKKYPGIKWRKVLGIEKAKTIVSYVPGRKLSEEDREAEKRKQEEKREETEKREARTISYDSDGHADIAEYEREIEGGYDVEVDPYQEVDLAEYAADETAMVNLDKLDELGLLPSFLGDVYSCVKRNLLQASWEEGWNKRLRAPMGNYHMCGGEGDNLIILDVSHSIPEGISSTMLTMIDTMRSKVDADLIVTGGDSLWFGKDDELPSPEELRRRVPRSNESYMFNDILVEHVSLHDWDNVIAFGDNDTPIYDDRTARALSSVKVGRFWHYHTGRFLMTWNGDVERRCGYAKWDSLVAEVKEPPSFDTSWCKIINE